MKTLSLAYRAVLLTSVLTSVLAMAAGATRAQDVAGAPNVAKRTTDNREGALDSFVNLETNDPSAKLDILQQEVFAAEQQNVATLFLLEYGASVDMKFVRYPSGEELIPAYVFRPLKPTAGKRYPAVILLHGGYHERFNVEWFSLISEMIHRGYVVIFPEYRGSRGYGDAIYQNDYGVTDTADVLAAADYMTKQSCVDPARLGIVGESRGGMVTLLAIEQAPKRFKAAVDIVGLTDFVAYMAYKPEYRRQEIAKENAHFGGKGPNEDLAAYMAVSPINGVDKIETPLLVMGTTGDKIAPFELHGGRLIDLLKAHDKVFDSHVYDHAPGGHVFMHGDSPDRADAVARTFAWLDKYLTP
jgi:dipeptidyl aminopeptidase/acylaminoacyl peptidase